MEERFGHTFGQVRIHTDGQAAQSARDVHALAYTVGRDVVFGAGQYQPQTSAGRQLIAHELTHVVQQEAHATSPNTALSIDHPSSPGEREATNAAAQIFGGASGVGAQMNRLNAPVIQRREYPAGTDATRLHQGDWLVNDRVHATARWQTANLLNLVNQRPHEYTQPHERRDFYLWVYNYTSGLGFETRWPLAAYLVASGAARLSYGTPFENDVQVAARRGNQIIFDDVFPKLRALVTGPPLKGAAAQAWDAQTLSEEQELIQAMYTSTSSKTVDQFGRYARQKGFLATAGSLSGFTQPHRRGRFHHAQDTPAFSGDIRSIDDRFAYGMRLADQFSTHPGPAGPIQRPFVGEQYTSGDAFRRLDMRRGLHQLDAELDDFNVDEEAVIRLMQGLSVEEQEELGFNDQRLVFLRDALDAEEMERALRNLSHVPAAVRRALRT